jgi:hypothetical protein
MTRRVATASPPSNVVPHLTHSLVAFGFVRLTCVSVRTVGDARMHI